MEHFSSAATVDRNFVSHSVNFLVRISGKIFVWPKFILHGNNLIAKGSKIQILYYTNNALNYILVKKNIKIIKSAPAL